MSDKYKYKISVIVPIYKVEEYLEETLVSVINQTMNFKKNIQLILINDGSPDKSYEICLKYKELYPDNVVYIEKENAGVSAARNEGLKYVQGKYVNFLDSDDVWDLDVFNKVYKMFENNEELSVIGVRQKYFEAQTNYPSLDFKFDKDKVVDVSEHFDHIQLSVTSCFFRTDKIGDLKYDSRIKYSEDAKFIYEFMINNKTKKIGFISTSVHNYRKRISGTSAIQTKDTKIDWYNQTVRLSYLYLLDYANKKYKPLLKTIQYYVLYDYQWRLKFDFINLTSFTEKEKKDYISDTKKILNLVDDEIILSQRQLSEIYKHYALKLKYDSYSKATDAILKLIDNNISINITNVVDNNLSLEGSIDLIYDDELEFLYKSKNSKNHEKLDTSVCLYNSSYYTNMTNENLKRYYFKLEINLEENDIEFYVKYGNIIRKLNIVFGPWSNISKHKRSYHNYNRFTICNKNNSINISKRSIFNTLKHELKMQISLVSHKKVKNAIYRILYFITKPFYKKQVWIFTDRKNVAGDNGEALFKYVTSLNRENIKCYFALEKGSKDVDRMKKYGNVVNFDTFRYNLLFLHCKKLISSHADPYVYQPFGRNNYCMSDLFNYKYVFLQHGIIKDDLSGWLNKFNKKFSLFITSTLGEYNSILSSKKYGYEEDILKLTGLARYDYLVNKKNPSKTIMIAPTWRASLVGKVIPGTQIRIYNETFKDSSFCKFYNKLLNDEEIIKCLKAKKYKIRLCLHPALSNQIKDFEYNKKYVTLVTDINYNEEFAQNKILITDYSSVAFDFAYLKKPIIYNQFDKEEFFGGHTYKEGYFSYEKDGFGDVVSSYEDLKKVIIKTISNDCVMQKKYINRVEKFFKYTDKNNCKRILEEIDKLK